MSRIAGFRPRSLAVALALSLLPSAAARAQSVLNQPRVEDGSLKGLAFSFDVYGLRRLDDAQKGWQSGEAWSALGLEVAYDLVPLGESTRLALAIGWVSEERAPGLSSRSFAYEATGRAAETISGNLKTSSLHAGAILRWRTDRLLQPYVALAVGATGAALTLNPWSGDSRIPRSTARGVLGRASVGIRIQPSALTARRANGDAVLGMALGLEVGALAGTPLEFSLAAPATLNGLEPVDRIPVESVRLGDLGQSGGYGRLAAMVIF